MIVLLLYLIFYLPEIKLNSACLTFQEGMFTYEEGEFKGVKILRRGNEQIEGMGDSIVASFYIEWVDDCKYILVPKTVKYKSKEFELPKDTIFVNIIEVISDASYRYSSVMKGIETQNVITRKMQF